MSPQSSITHHRITGNLVDGGIRQHGLREGQREGVAVIRRSLAALLHVGLAFKHQQVAAIDVVTGPGEIHRHLFIGLDRAMEEPVLHLASTAAVPLGLHRGTNPGAQYPP
jgi:hypothetical protein